MEKYFSFIDAIREREDENLIKNIKENKKQLMFYFKKIFPSINIKELLDSDRDQLSLYFRKMDNTKDNFTNAYEICKILKDKRLNNVLFYLLKKEIDENQ